MAKKVVDITAQDQKAIKALQNDLELYNMNITDDPEESNPYYMKAVVLVKLAKLMHDDSYNSTTLKKALESFNKAIELSNSENPLYLIDRSNLYVKIGLTDLAVADLKKVGELPQSSGITGIYINNTVRDITKLEAIQNTIQGLATSGKINKELANALQEHAKVTAGLVVQVGEQGDRLDKNDDRVGSLETLVKQLQQQIQEGTQFSQEEMIKLVKQQTAEIEAKLDNKLDDYLKKLIHELDHSLLPLEDKDKTKIHDYYKAFIGTFSSVYVTAQIIDSGQIKLDTGSLKVTTLSTLVSFIPLIGSGLSTTVTSLNDFIIAKEMKINAKKVKNLAGDSTHLSQLVGSSALAIVTTQNKQQEIITITDKALEKVTTSLYQKIKAFCAKVEVKIDDKLYGEMYQTPASKLGHNDANILIEKWITGEIQPSSDNNTTKQFVEQIISIVQNKGAEEEQLTNATVAAPTTFQGSGSAVTTISEARKTVEKAKVEQNDNKKKNSEYPHLPQSKANEQLLGVKHVEDKEEKYREEEIANNIPVKPQPKLQKPDSSSCCTIMAINEVVYDNPLLNDHRIGELLKLAKEHSGMMGVNRLLDIGCNASIHAKFQDLRQKLGDEGAIKYLFCTNSPNKLGVDGVERSMSARYSADNSSGSSTSSAEIASYGYALSGIGSGTEVSELLSVTVLGSITSGSTTSIMGFEEG